MKANELMIGDWVIAKVVVNSKGNTIPQITKVTDILEDGINAVYCGGELDDYIEETMIKPIPLTEEILKANDICYQFGCPWWQKADPFGSPNQYEVHINRVTTVIVTYVHQLQMALRCCDLWDMANNFKLTSNEQNI